MVANENLALMAAALPLEEPPVILRSSNGFLHRPTTRKEIESGTGHGMWHGLPEELRITTVMTAMERAHETRESNSRALEAQREAKRKRDELVKEESLSGATGEYIECLIYHRMWNSERCWNLAAQVKAGLKKLQYKYEKEELLKDNILMRYKGMGWATAHTTWSKDGKKKTLQELQKRLIEIIKETKSLVIPSKPPTKVPQRKNFAILGTLTHRVKDNDAKRAATEEEFDL